MRRKRDLTYFSTFSSQKGWILGFAAFWELWWYMQYKICFECRRPVSRATKITEWLKVYFFHNRRLKLSYFHDFDWRERPILCIFRIFFGHITFKNDRPKPFLDSKWPQSRSNDILVDVVGLTPASPFDNAKNTKITFRTEHDGICSKLIAKQLGVTLYMVTPGGQIPKFWPKMTPNIGIIQITSQFGPFDNAYIWSPWGVKYTNFDEKSNQILVLCK